MPVIDILLGALNFVWELFQAWLQLFYMPFSNFNIIWIIIPIWLSWFFAEFFQEKKGTSLGNAISNGVIPFWVGIDWTRFLTTSIISKQLEMEPLTFVKYLICVLVLVYGFMVIFFGIRGKQVIRKLGRVREITYILLMFSPIVYGLVELEWKFMMSLFLFFPVFYYIIELIDRITPDPKIIKMDVEKAKESLRGAKDDLLSGSSRGDIFSSGTSPPSAPPPRPTQPRQQVQPARPIQPPQQLFRPAVRSPRQARPVFGRRF